MTEEAITVLSLPYHGNRTKTVRVFVPAHEEGETLPVIYMTDGQNLFESSPLQYGCWFTREAVREEQTKGSKGAVIVGIHNDGTPLERACELLPGTIATLLPPQGPGAEQAKDLVPEGEIFDDFILRTVMPAVEAQFPVKTGKAHTAFCGSSFGGLESFFTVLSHPDRYAAGGFFSPVFMMFQKEELKDWIFSKTGDPASLSFLYLYMGGSDDMEKALTPDFELVCDTLQQRCHEQQFKKLVRKDMPHHETAWKTAFQDFLHIFLSQQ